jgi:uncharacterized membrane protein
MDFIYFLGRFHVLVLHIPIGIIAAILFVEFMARKEKYAHLLPASPFLWNAAAVSAVVTVILGYMHFAEGGFEGSSGYQHRNFGTGLAVIISVVAVLRSSRFASAYAPVYLPAAVLMVFLVSLVGHYGGNLTHGSSYLVEYAPQPLRSLEGLAPRRPPVESLAAADPFHDLVGPMFASRCWSCHSSDQRQGELNLETFDSVMRGGETGSVVVAGRPQVSELLRRISLAPNDDEFMPAEDKTPLSEAQVQIIEWWITAGAPVDTSFAELDAELPAATEALIRTELGL